MAILGFNCILYFTIYYTMFLQSPVSKELAIELFIHVVVLLLMGTSRLPHSLDKDH